MTVHPFSSDVTLERRKERVAGRLAGCLLQLATSRKKDREK
jgi:hypothetical protein